MPDYNDPGPNDRNLGSFGSHPDHEPLASLVNEFVDDVAGAAEKPVLDRLIPDPSEEVAEQLASAQRMLAFAQSDAAADFAKQMGLDPELLQSYLMSTVMGALAQVSDGLMHGGQRSVTKIGSVVSDAADTLTSGVKSVGTSAMALLKDAGGALKSEAGELFREAGGAFKAEASDFARSAGSAALETAGGMARDTLRGLLTKGAYNPDHDVSGDCDESSRQGFCARGEAMADAALKQGLQSNSLADMLGTAAAAQGAKYGTKLAGKVGDWAREKMQKSDTGLKTQAGKESRPAAPMPKQATEVKPTAKLAATNAAPPIRPKITKPLPATPTQTAPTRVSNPTTGPRAALSQKPLPATPTAKPSLHKAGSFSSAPKKPLPPLPKAAATKSAPKAVSKPKTPPRKVTGRTTKRAPSAPRPR